MEWNEMVEKRNALEVKDRLTKEEADTLEFLSQRIDDLTSDIEIYNH